MDSCQVVLPDKEAISEHNSMVDVLGTELQKEELERLKNRFRRDPVDSADIDRIRNIFELFEQLMRHEVIDYGKYDRLVSVLRGINPKVATLLENHGKKIWNILNKDEISISPTKVKDTFMKTRASDKAFETLLDNRCVVLLGKEGEGKTAIAKHLAACLTKECDTLQVKYITEEINIAAVRMMQQGIFILEDIQYFSNPFSLIDSLLKKVQERENTYLIITGSLDLADTLKEKTAQMLTIDASINLSSESYVFDDQEKERMVQVVCEMFQREDVLSGCISVLDESIEMPFPLVIYHFFRNENFVEKGLSFFQNIQYHLDKEIYDLIEEDKSKTREEIIIALLCSEIPLKTDVDSLRGILKMNHIELPLAGIGQDNLDKELEFLNGKCLKRLGQRKCVALNTWSFEAMAIYLLRKRFLLTIEKLDIDWVLRKVYITNCNQENGVVSLESPDSQRILAKRLLTVLGEDGNKYRETIMRHAFMNNAQFIDLIITTPDLKSMVVTHEKKHLHRGNEKALFLCLSAVCSNKNMCNALIKLYKDVFPQNEVHAMSYAVQFALQNSNLDCTILQDLINHGADMNFLSTDVPPPCALQIAAERNEDKTVQLLLRNRAFVPKTKWHFWNFLHFAADKGDQLICNSKLLQALLQGVTNGLEENKYKSFISKTVDLQPYSKRDCIHFLFMFAERFGINDALVQAFCKCSINLTCTDKTGSNIFHILLQSRLEQRVLHKSLYAAGVATLKTMIVNKANTNGEYAIHIAVRKHKANTVRLMIDDLNADLTMTGKHDMNSLHLCVTSETHDDIEASCIAAILLKHCNPTGQNAQGKSAIDLAMDRSFERIKTLCVLLGVDFDPNDDVIPMYLLTRLPRNQSNEIIMETILSHANIMTAELTPLLHSLKEGHYDWVNYFIERNVVLAEHSDPDGNTALHYCLIGKLSDQQKTLTSECLLKLGCNINDVNSQHETALCRAMRCPEFVDVVKHTLAHLKPNINVKDTDGSPTTIIHKLITSSFDDETVSSMLRIVFQTNSYENLASVRNSKGQTYLQLALNETQQKRDNTALFLLNKCHRFVTDDTLRILLHSCINSKCDDGCIRDMCYFLINTAEKDTLKNICGHIDAAAEHALSILRYLPQTLALLLTTGNAYLRRDVFQIALEKKKLQPSFVLEIKRQRDVGHWKDTDVVRGLMESDDISPGALKSILNRLKLYGVHIHGKDRSSLSNAVKGRAGLDKINVLIDMGANRHYLDPEGHILAHICVASNRSDECTVSLIKKLNPNDVNSANEKGETAIMAAVQRGKLQTLDELLKRGAHINMIDKQGKSVLHHCVESPQCDLLVCDMLDRICLRSTKENKKDKEGRTPVNAAAAHEKQSRIFTILRLAQCKCDVNIKDKKGSSPLENALKLHGVTPTIKCERVCRVAILVWLKAKPCPSAMEECENNKQALYYENILLRAKQTDLLQTLKTSFSQTYELLENEGDFTIPNEPGMRVAPNLHSDLNDLIGPISYVLSGRDLDYSIDENNESDFQQT